MKKFFISFVGVAVLLFSSFGCATRYVWDVDNKYKYEKDKIIAFYIDENSTKLMLVGEKYHYIFEKNCKGPAVIHEESYFGEDYEEKCSKQGFDTFAKIITNRKFLNLKIGNIKINTFETIRDKPNFIYANFSILFDKKKLSQQQYAWLSKNARAYELKKYQYENMILFGKRYLASKEANDKLIKLEKPIDINIAITYTDEMHLLNKLALTPLAVVGDIVLVTVFVAVGIVSLPFAVIYSLFDGQD